MSEVTVDIDHSQVELVTIYILLLYKWWKARTAIRQKVFQGVALWTASAKRVFFLKRIVIIKKKKKSRRLKSYDSLIID